jgi:hypothetical protein
MQTNNKSSLGGILGGCDTMRVIRGSCFRSVLLLLLFLLILFFLLVEHRHPSIVRAGTNCTWFYVKISQFLVYQRFFVLVQILREILELLLHFCAGIKCTLVLV